MAAPSQHFSSMPFSSEQGRVHELDRQIQELNQELENLLGPSGDQISDHGSAHSAHGSNSISQKHLSDGEPSPLGKSVLTVTHVNSSVPGPKSPVDSLSHVDAHGNASMVNVSEKAFSKREAVATGKVLLGRTVFGLVRANQIAKGDVLAVARIAGICGAKQTGNLIPLCHNIALSNVQVNLKLDEEENAVDIRAQVSAIGPTGVEMEALTAVSVAALTVYDMCKAVSKHVKVNSVQLESKTGGKSGDWCRNKESVYANACAQP